MFEGQSEDKPMLIGCQYQILDKILQYILNEELNAGKIRSTNIKYNFIPSCKKIMMN